MSQQQLFPPLPNKPGYKLTDKERERGKRWIKRIKEERAKMKPPVGSKVRMIETVGEFKKGEEFTVIDHYRFGPEVFVSSKTGRPTRIPLSYVEGVK